MESSQGIREEGMTTLSSLLDSSPKVSVPGWLFCYKVLCDYPDSEGQRALLLRPLRHGKRKMLKVLAVTSALKCAASKNGPKCLLSSSASTVLYPPHPGYTALTFRMHRRPILCRGGNDISHFSIFGCRLDA